MTVMSDTNYFISGKNYAGRETIYFSDTIYEENPYPTLEH